MAPESDEQSRESKNPIDWKEISSDSSPNLLQSPLTHAGGVLGTPLYMAPEQHLGLKTDERTDQFGFCVVLYEALYGKRPFLAATMEKLKREVIRQQVRPPRADTDVPAWLWKIIYKGLSAKPEDRYPTIDSLLEELDKDPEEVRRQKTVGTQAKAICDFIDPIDDRATGSVFGTDCDTEHFNCVRLRKVSLKVSGMMQPKHR